MGTPERFRAEGKYKTASDKKANTRPLIFAICGDGSAGAGNPATIAARTGGWYWIRLVGDNNRVTQCFSPIPLNEDDLIFVRRANDRNLSYYEFAEFIEDSGGGVVPPVAPHALLGPSHDDTLTDAPSLGSIIKGVAGPDWDEFVVGAARQIPQVNAGATDFAWVAFDWDLVNAAAGADMVHDHSVAAEGGQNLRQIQEFEFDDATILTIDGAGAVVRTQAYHIIAANAGVADNLDNATGGVEGDELIIRPDAGDTITVRHNQGGAGDFWFAGGAHIVLNNQDHLRCVHDGTSWCDSGGGTVVAHTILSATHTDTIVAGVQVGDVITGQGGPAWGRVAIDPQGRFLKSDGTNAAWALISGQTVTVGPGTTGDSATLGGAVVIANILIAGGPPTAANPVVILVFGIVTAEAGNVTIPSHCYVKGLGEESCIGMGANQLIFSADSGAQDIRVTGNPGATTGLIYANNATSVILRNVRAIESTNLGYAFYFTGTSTVWLYDCVGEVTGTGASVFVSTSTATWFRDCRADVSGSTAIGFNLGGTGDMFLKGCVADDTTNFTTGLNIGNTACTVETEDCSFRAATNDVQTGAASTWVYHSDNFDYENCTVAGTADPADGQPVVWFDWTITVGAGKDFATVQNAIDHAKGRNLVGLVTIVIDAGVYNENLVVDDIFAANSGALELQGDTRVTAGLSYVSGNAVAAAWAAGFAYAAGNHVRPVAGNNGFYYVCQVPGLSGGAEPAWPVVIGGTVVDNAVTWLCVGVRANQNAQANGGTGCCMVTAAGAVVTVQCSTANPNFAAAGWVNGDKVLIYNNAGAVAEYTIQATAANAITLTVAAPAMGNLGTSITLCPNREINAGGNTAFDVDAVKGIKATGLRFNTTGANICIHSHHDAAVEVYNSVVYGDGTVLSYAIHVNDKAQVIANDTSFVQCWMTCRSTTLANCNANYTYSIKPTLGYDAFFFGNVAANSSVCTGGAWGFQGRIMGQCSAGSSHAIGCTVGFNSEMGGVLYAAAGACASGAIAHSCTTGHQSTFQGFLNVGYSMAVNCTTGYRSAYNSYMYAVGTVAQCAGNTANHSPAITDTEGNVSAIITFN